MSETPCVELRNISKYFAKVVANQDVSLAIRKALRLDPLAAAVVGAGYSWDKATDQFAAALREAARPLAEAARPPAFPQMAVPA